MLWYNNGIMLTELHIVNGIALQYVNTCTLLYRARNVEFKAYLLSCFCLHLVIKISV